MPTYDSVLTRQACVNGHEGPVEAQYSYGPVRYRQRVIGEAIDWALEANERVGSPRDRVVRVLAEVVYHDLEAGGFSFRCPVCGAPYEEAVVEIHEGVIADVRQPLDGEVEALQVNGDLIVDA
jgi:hypothetical protein